MLTECLENEEYAAAFKTKGPQNSAEDQHNRNNTEQSKEEKVKVSLYPISVVWFSSRLPSKSSV
jgi:hypothetical protein